MPELNGSQTNGSTSAGYPIGGFTSISAPDLLNTASLDRQSRYSHVPTGYHYNIPELHDFINQMNQRSALNNQVQDPMFNDQQPLSAPIIPLSNSDVTFNSFNSLNYSPNIANQQQSNPRELARSRSTSLAQPKLRPDFNFMPTQPVNLDLLKNIGLRQQQPGFGQQDFLNQDFTPNTSDDLLKEFLPESSTITDFRQEYKVESENGYTPSPTDINLYLAGKSLNPEDLDKDLELSDIVHLEPK